MSIDGSLTEGEEADRLHEQEALERVDRVLKWPSQANIDAGKEKAIPKDGLTDAGA
jgi:hypothetical protein